MEEGNPPFSFEEDLTLKGWTPSPSIDGLGFFRGKISFFRGLPSPVYEGLSEEIGFLGLGPPARSSACTFFISERRFIAGSLTVNVFRFSPLRGERFREIARPDHLRRRSGPRHKSSRRFNFLVDNQ